MKKISLWLEALRDLWSQKSIVWLSGVRRVGKTCLCRQIPDAHYLNCDLPSVQRQLADPEFFLSQHPSGQVLILDEVQRIEDPSLLLKIAADAHPEIQILATAVSLSYCSARSQIPCSSRNGWTAFMPAIFSSCSASVYRTGFLSLLRPICLRSGGHREILRRPKIYVLDELLTVFPLPAIHYWRDKSQREVDFTVERRENKVDTFEAKISPDAIDAKNLRAFRQLHLQENNYLVCPAVEQLYPIRRGGFKVVVCSTQHLATLQDGLRNCV